MNTTRTLTRLLALPILSAGIIGGAALGLAGTASAATSTQPTGPGYSYAPSVKAHPAPTASPGAQNHRGVNRVIDRTPGI
jgi:hypothetical protein